MIQIPPNILDDLLVRCERDVLALTVHVLRNPTRIQFLDAEGNLVSYAAPQQAAPMTLGLGGVSSFEAGWK